MRSRRELGFLIPALAAAQSPAPGQKAPSKTFRIEDMPVRKGATSQIRQIMSGETHSNFFIDLHETELAAGQAPHAPHQHVHEEMVLLREGELEVTISGKVTKLGPGSVVFIASGEMHGWRNPGSVPTKYFVLALGRDK